MSPQLPYSVTIPPNIIILLHGFNSAPGNKAKEIEEFLSEKKIKDKYKLIAPTIDYEPIKARRDINKIIRQNKIRKVYLIGTSLGGFYANYFLKWLTFLFDNHPFQVIRVSQTTKSHHQKYT